MAGYYIQGLLNTETAYDSYCIYGYKSDIDKRYFCAVRISNVFYSSYRESAYINVYIYCKGQQVSTLKCISNTGSEYDVSTSHYSTTDPTITKIYEHPVWSNMNGRQATMADFISNVPILNGVNLSDTERDALAINYLNNVPEPYGQGTVTLSVKRPGQTLNFTSRLLSKTISQYISGDAVITIEGQSSQYAISRKVTSFSGSSFSDTQIASVSCEKPHVGLMQVWSEGGNFSGVANLLYSYGECKQLSAFSGFAINNCQGWENSISNRPVTLTTNPSFSSTTNFVFVIVIVSGDDMTITRNELTNLYIDTTLRDLCSLSLDAGRYLLFGEIMVQNQQVAETYCQISVGNNVVAKSQWYRSQIIGQAHATMVYAIVEVSEQTTAVLSAKDITAVSGNFARLNAFKL